MLSPLRTRAGRRLREPFGKAGLTVAVIALVFAMLGGAYAASHRHDKKGSSAGLTSKQKKEVKKLAEQYAGKNGADGAQGPKGDPGSSGANGTNGVGGSSGASVLISEPAPGCGSGGVVLEVEGIPASAEEVCNGEDGTDGLDGKSVHVGTVLPGPTEGCGEAGGIEVEVEGSGEPPEYVCNGKSGSGGGGFKYAFSTNVEETDPTAGNLKLNNATLASATKLLVSETDGEANALANEIHRWTTGVSAQGTLTIREEGHPSSFAEYSVGGGIACTAVSQKNKPGQCGMKDEGSYDAINVSLVVANTTSFGAAEPVTITYSSSASSTLPVGSIETGTWAFSRSVDKFTVEVGGVTKEETVGNSQRILVPLTLSVPLRVNISGAAKVHWFEEANYGTFCEGPTFQEEPIPANSGEVCISRTEIFPEPHPTSFEQVFRAGTYQGPGGAGNGFGRYGGVLAFTKPTASVEAMGTFAVKG